MVDQQRQIVLQSDLLQRPVFLCHDSTRHTNKITRISKLRLYMHITDNCIEEISTRKPSQRQVSARQPCAYEDLFFAISPLFDDPLAEERLAISMQSIHR